MSKEDIGQERLLKSGEYLFREKDRGDEMYLIKGGKIRITKEMGGEEKPLAVLNEGAFFGEMAIIDNKSRSASAIAEEDTELIIVNKEAFLNKVNENAFIKYVIVTLIQRLRETNEMWMYQGIHNAKARLISYIRYKAEENNKGSGINIDSRVPLNYNLISTAIAMEPSIIKDFLNELERENILTIKDTIIINSLEKIKEYEDFVVTLEEFKKIEEYEDIVRLREELGQ